MNYTFYVYTNEKTLTKTNIDLDEAIERYKKINTKEYKALGVTKDGLYSCDLVNNKGKHNSNKISSDYTKLDNFKNDDLIVTKLITLLELAFNL